MNRVYNDYQPLGAFQLIDPDTAVFLTVAGGIIAVMVWG